MSASVEEYIDLCCAFWDFLLNLPETNIIKHATGKY
jgi:hypothetical protein